MPASLADSAIYNQLFGDDQASDLFSDDAELRSLLLVEGALARLQGAMGVIPAEAAAWIDRAASDVQIDPATLAIETAHDGVPVPALLAAFRKAAGRPEMMQYLHWGATSQDIMDTALALRLRRVLDLWDARLVAVLGRLATLAEAHAQTPMAARTYGQVATPTSFGAVVASWGWPLLGWREDIAAVRVAVQCVSLSGAAGSADALGPRAADLRAALAKELDLRDPGHSRHTDRSGIARLAGFAAGLSGSMGKMGEDLLLMTQSGLAEVTLSGGGGSSTMPQKQNPVLPSALVALVRQVIALAPMLHGASLHRQQRDGAAWFTEWLTLPQLCLSMSRLLSLGEECATRIQPDLPAMARPLTESPGLVHAEALVFALAQHMPRPEAQDLIAGLCRTALATGRTLPSLVVELHPEFSGPDVLCAPTLGSAPSEAFAFAAAVRANRS